MSTFEDGQNTTQSPQNMHNNKQQQQQQLTPPKEESGDEGEDQHPHHHKQEPEDATSGSNNNAVSGSNNNSIMGKMKKLSSILPDSFSKWFSPGRNGGKASSIVAEDHQYNGQPTTKRKRGRRRIQLEPEEDDSPASGFDVDDGAEAPGLDDDEVALADNIAEHDLAAEDEQSRCNEYNNIYLFRKRRTAGNNAVLRNVANDVDVDDDDDDDDEEEEDEVPEVEAYEYDIDRLGGPQKQISKRRRVEGEKVVTLRGLRNLPVLVSSTPDHHQQQQQGLSSSHRYAPHRMTHMNLYGCQRQREPAYNFFAGTEAAVATSGDLPFSTRRTLNILYTTDRSQQQQALPTYKRQSLLTQRTPKATPWRTSTTIDEVHEGSSAVPANPTDSDNNNEFCPKNNNNNIITTKRSLENIVESSGESGEREGTVGINSRLALGRPSPLHNQHHYGSNSNLDFYGNLQSAKSIFNRSSASGVVVGGGGHHYHHHNSTLSLNSLSRRRRFNASIYGSTSALSDSRLLSSSTSATLAGGGFASSSPFYQGRTTFGGNSANNRNFSQGNLSSASASSLLAINSGGSSPAHPSSALTVTSQTLSIGNYGIKQIGVSHKLPPSSDSNHSQSTDNRIHNEVNAAGISHTAKRILQLLESYSSPLIDAQRMGSTLREHQVSRQIRGQQFTPYARPSTSTASTTSNTNATTTTSNSTKTPSALRPQNLLQEMFDTVERRRLHRVTQSSRKLVQSPTKQKQQQQQQQQYKLIPLPSNLIQELLIAAPAPTVTATATNPSPTLGSASTAPSTAPAFGEQQSYNHTNKMRSRLSHQVRKDLHSNMEAAPVPLDLPQLSFPQMANAPKFDLIIKPTPSVVAPVAQPPVHQIPLTTNATGVGAKPRRRFIFTTPLPLPSVVENDANSRGVAVPNAKLQSRRKFIFVPPTGLQDLSTTTTNTTTSTTMVTTDQTDQPSINGAGYGFGLQFNKSSKEWECDTCMIRNPETRNQCAACESPKPGPAAAPPVTATQPQASSWPAASEGFGQRFKKSSTAWECDVCMLTNKEEAIKCIACETPRKNVTKSSSSTAFTPAPAPLVSFGFGDAFKSKANTWECPTCMITNQSTSTECVACQTHNPTSSSTTSINESSTVKFGVVAAPKQDEKFQQLVADQKSSKWNCDACMAQNEMNRLKCICCDNLKPGSGEATKSTEPGTVSSTASMTAAAVPTFSFGFATIKETTSSSSIPLAATASLSTNPNPLPLFSFGQNNKQAVTFSSPSTQYKFGIQKTDSDKIVEQSKEEQSATKMVSFNENPPQLEKTATTDTSVTSGYVFKSPIASTMANSNTTITTTSSGFTFPTTAAIVSPSSSSSSLSTVSSSTSSSSIGSAIKPMFQFPPTSGASASTGKVSSSTQPRSPQTAGGLNLFGVTTATTATVTPTPAPAPAGGLFSFGTQGKQAASATAPLTTSSFTSTSHPGKPNTFFFGQQPGANVTTDMAASGTNSNSIFGAGTATSNSSTLTTTKPSGTPLGGFNFGENKAAAPKSSDAATSGGNTATAGKSAAGFIFGTSGGGSLGATSFGWPMSNGGGTTSTSSTTTAISSFSTTTTPAMATAVVSSSTTSSGSSLTTTPHVFGRSCFGSTTPASGNLFGLAGSGTSTSGATGAISSPAMSILGVNSGATGSAISSVFGNVNNPFGSAQAAPTAAVAPNVAATQQPAAAVTNIFGSAATKTTTLVAAAPATTPAFGASGGFAAAAAAGGAPATAKPAFNFGSAASSVGTALTPGSFNFGASANVASTTGGGGVVGSIKPPFNFTGSATVATPQTATFNFTGNSGPLTGAAAASGNTGHQTDAFGAQPQPSQQRVFLFGGAATPFNSDGNGAGTAAPPPTITSTNVPAMFNFTATPTQMQSAAPFPFSASAPSASASATTNIFAFNSPTAGNSSPNSTQMGRRKIRATMRRLPPR